MKKAIHLSSFVALVVLSINISIQSAFAINLGEACCAACNCEPDCLTICIDEYTTGIAGHEEISPDIMDLSSIDSTESQLTYKEIGQISFSKYDAKRRNTVVKDYGMLVSISPLNDSSLDGFQDWDCGEYGGYHFEEEHDRIVVRSGGQIVHECSPVAV